LNKKGCKGIWYWRSSRQYTGIHLGELGKTITKIANIAGATTEILTSVFPSNFWVTTSKYAITTSLHTFLRPSFAAVVQYNA
jgi:hypothetical protein